MVKSFSNVLCNDVRSCPGPPKVMPQKNNGSGRAGGLPNVKYFSRKENHLPEIVVVSKQERAMEKSSSRFSSNG